MKKLMILSLMILCAASGFAQKSRETLVNYQEAQSRMLDVQTNVYFRPLTVEAEIIPNPKSGKIERVKQVYELDAIQLESLGGKTNELRAWASFRLSEEYDADVIVGAMFNIEYNSQMNAGKVTIMGYPARFNNWRTATDADLEWMRLEKYQYKTEADKTNPVIRN